MERIEYSRGALQVGPLPVPYQALFGVSLQRRVTQCLAWRDKATRRLAAFKAATASANWARLKVAQE